MINNKIILIGGTPTAGKSYLAKRLARELDLPWISTDTIREMMRKIVKKEDYPNLMNFELYSPEKYFEEFTADQIVEHQISQSMETWQGIKALIDTDYVWESFIIEGVGILPELVHKNYKDELNIKPIFLITTNKERIKEVVYTRGLWGEADKYPHSIKDQEIEWAYKFSLWLKAEAGKYGYPTFEVTQLDFPVSELEKLI